MPPAPDERVAHVHEEPVAGVGRLRRVVPAAGADVEGRVQILVTPVHDVVEERLVAFGHVDRLEDVEVDVVLDEALRVAWGAFDVHDRRVDGVLGIRDPERAAGELFVLADLAEGASLEGRGLDLVDDELGDARERRALRLCGGAARRLAPSVGRGRRAREDRDREQDDKTLHSPASPLCAPTKSRAPVNRLLRIFWTSPARPTSTRSARRGPRGKLPKDDGLPPRDRSPEPQRRDRPRRNGR